MTRAARKRWWRWPLRMVVVACLLLGVAYGALRVMLPGAITCAPNAKKAPDLTHDPHGEALRALGVAEHFRVKVGPPEASLSVFIVNPAQGTPKGTIIVFHGIRDSKRSMLGVGRRLSQEGFRVVLVDGRGHGRSSGRVLSYGVFERVDAKKVIDAIEARALLVRPLGALGFSYGGSIAIQLGAMDERVDAVASISTFSSLRVVLKSYVRLFAPGAGHLLSDAQIDDVVTKAAREGGFDADEADTEAAAKKLGVPLLVLHGAGDSKIPVAHSRRICEAAKDRCRRLVMPGEGHDAMLADRSGRVWREVRGFFRMMRSSSRR